MTGIADRQRQFEEYLRDGISAAKSGERKMAQLLLNRALYLNSADARPYIWLAATSTDTNEQIEHLEKAIALDPTNAAAVRGLALLKGKIDREKLSPEGGVAQALVEQRTMEANSAVFTCLKCGGRMSFSVDQERLTCEYCGHTQSRQQISDDLQSNEAEQVLNFVMPTTRGHLWAAAQHRLVCEGCGATTILPAGQRASQCPYCTSNQMAESTEMGELVEPQAIILMKLDERAAIQKASQWLASGFFSPDNLSAAARSLQLRPAYYSCWNFSGAIELRWSCEIAEGNGNYKTWVPRQGSEMEFFDDVLVSGVKELPEAALNSLEPFDLKKGVEFLPEHLAGWPVLLYDRSLSEASLLARERIVRQMRIKTYDLIEIGHEKRNVQFGAGSWSGITFKHLLLPIWIGNYQFKGQSYLVLVNGQTGQVGGEKPRDMLKPILIALAAGLALFFIGILLWLLWQV